MHEKRYNEARTKAQKKKALGDPDLQRYNKHMIITTTEDLEEFCAPLHDMPFITVDTEFLREKTYYPKLCLIQVSGPDKNAAAIDPLAQGIDLRPFFKLLFNEDILKIFHAGRQDLEIIFNLTGQTVKPLFDTQIAAMVCGYGDQIGYEALVNQTVGASIDKSSQFTDWSRRPLSDKQLNYALSDVTHLCDIYHHLEDKLERNKRAAWVTEEEKTLQDPSTFKADPYQSWKKIKVKSPKPQTLMILKELAAWRERHAQKRNLPKAWVIKDDTLSAIAMHAPHNEAELAKIRGMNDEIARGRVGQKILHYIEKARKTPKDQWPQHKKKKILEADQAAYLDALKMLLRIESAQNGVAARLIGTQDDLELIARGEHENTQTMAGWRYDVFGQYAQDLKNGKLAIGMRDGKIVKFEINDQLPLKTAS